MLLASIVLFNSWIVWLQQSVWIIAVIAAAAWWHSVQWFVFRMTKRLTSTRRQHLRRRREQAMTALQFAILPMVVLGLIIWIKAPEKRNLVISLEHDSSSALTLLGSIVTMASAIWACGLMIGDWYADRYRKRDTRVNPPDWWHSDPY